MRNFCTGPGRPCPLERQSGDGTCGASDMAGNENRHCSRFGIGLRANVQSIVMACGIANVGRFTARYKATYGELPSETLARGRR
jgi:hypothetical protein